MRWCWVVALMLLAGVAVAQEATDVQITATTVITFHAEATDVDVTAASVAAPLENPTIIVVAAESVPAFPAIAEAVNIDALTTPGFLGEPTGVAFTGE